MLQDKFYTLCQNFTSDKELSKNLWIEIKTSYSDPNRYYHTLKHLEYIYTSLENIEIDSVIEFSIFYHDIIYDVEKNNNKEKSAFLAKKRLAELNVSQKIQNEVFELILKTKTHQTTSQKDSLFLDADLTILASPKKIYQNYIYNIRKEYTLYSDKVYNNGRKEVLKFFLKQERLYSSDYFHRRYEKIARKNLESELKSLS
jgi:predicted metal-dependent HD superfamily phosphohydrolase